MIAKTAASDVPVTGVDAVTGTLTVAVSRHLAGSDALVATAASITGATPGVGLQVVDIDDEPEAAIRLGIVAAPAVVVDAGGRRKVLSGRPSARKLCRALHAQLGQGRSVASGPVLVSAPRPVPRE